MILNNVKIGDRVIHDIFGIGTVTGFEDKARLYDNWLLVEFDSRPGLHVISPRSILLKDVKI